MLRVRSPLWDPSAERPSHRVRVKLRPATSEGRHHREAQGDTDTLVATKRLGW
jgi:hypothetical protein